MTPRIGVILLDRGEPPEHNEHTYYSFWDFAYSLITMGMIPEVVLRAKRGTILMDRNKIFATEPHPNPDLIDAWLRPRIGPAEFVPERWLSATPAELPKGAYVPFGAGVHACIGQPLALATMWLALPTIGRRWRLRADRDAAVLVPRAPALRFTLERR